MHDLDMRYLVLVVLITASTDKVCKVVLVRIRAIAGFMCCFEMFLFCAKHRRIVGVAMWLLGV